MGYDPSELQLEFVNKTQRWSEFVIKFSRNN
jgi:hypothetical protein